MNTKSLSLVSALGSAFVMSSRAFSRLSSSVFLNPFNPAAEKAVLESEYAGDYQSLQRQHEAILEEKQTKQIAYGKLLENGTSAESNALSNELKVLRNTEELNRKKARELITKADPSAETNDKDFVFINFILNHLPKGLIGLLLAVIISAAMSSTASELNALSSTTTIDIYKRFRGAGKDDDHFVVASKWFTLLWGVIAITFASNKPIKPLGK